MKLLFNARHTTTRVRRDIKRRILTVTDVHRVTPLMQRVCFQASDLGDFESTAPDDHIKLFLPKSNQSSTGIDDVAVRTYTVRGYDPETGVITIDFALHQSGPGTSWALNARSGDTLEIGGPRKSDIVANDFDWYLLIGDETALPAIGRRVEKLCANVSVITLVVVEQLAERQTFATSAAWTPLWIPRDGQHLSDEDLLHLALSELQIPIGDGYIWIAAEAAVARSLRNYVSDILRHPKAWTKTSGYWVRGAPGAHT